MGWTRNRVRITRSKLAYEVAKKLNQYLESMTVGLHRGEILPVVAHN